MGRKHQQAEGEETGGLRTIMTWDVHVAIEDENALVRKYNEKNYII